MLRLIARALRSRPGRFWLTVGGIAACTVLVVALQAAHTTHAPSRALHASAASWVRLERPGERSAGIPTHADRQLCDAPVPRGGSWGTQGTIIFAPSAGGGLSIVSDAGGTPTPITTSTTPGESHRVPQFLPHGQRFLYYVQNTAADGVYVFDPATKQSRPRQFLDATGQLWAKGALVGKVGSVFVASATQHGGQESTILSFHTTLLQPMA